jgi:hypothetical protein
VTPRLPEWNRGRRKDYLCLCDGWRRGWRGRAGGQRLADGAASWTSRQGSWNGGGTSAGGTSTAAERARVARFDAAALSSDGGGTIGFSTGGGEMKLDRVEG